MPKAGFRPAGSHRVAFSWHWANRRLASHQSKTGLRAAENTQAAQCFPSSSTTVHVMLRLLGWFAFCVARAELLHGSPWFRQTQGVAALRVAMVWPNSGSPLFRQTHGLHVCTKLRAMVSPRSWSPWFHQTEGLATRRVAMVSPSSGSPRFRQTRGLHRFTKLRVSIASPERRVSIGSPNTGSQWSHQTQGLHGVAKLWISPHWGSIF